MFERYNDAARASIVQAQEQARALNHHFIGSEHILLGLLGQEVQVGKITIAQKVLQVLGIPETELGEAVEQAADDEGKVEPQGHIPFTPNGKRALEFALRESPALGLYGIGTGHLLNGLYISNSGIASEVLRAFSYDLKAARGVLLRNYKPEEIEPDVGEGFQGVLGRPQPKRNTSVKNGVYTVYDVPSSVMDAVRYVRENQ